MHSESLQCTRRLHSLALKQAWSLLHSLFVGISRFSRLARYDSTVLYFLTLAMLAIGLQAHSDSTVNWFACPITFSDLILLVAFDRVDKLLMKMGPEWAFGEITSVMLMGLPLYMALEGN